MVPLKARELPQSEAAAKDPKSKAYALLSLLRTKDQKLRIRESQAFAYWKLYSSNTFFNQRLQQASAMIDRMTRFSRNFISLNTLSTLFLKIKQRKMAAALIQLQRNISKRQPNHE